MQTVAMILAPSKDQQAEGSTFVTFITKLQLLNACLCTGPVQLNLFHNARVVLIRLGNVLNALVLVCGLQMHNSIKDQSSSSSSSSSVQSCADRAPQDPGQLLAEIDERWVLTCMKSSYFFLPEVSDAN
jgi:hypothetical protein